LTPAFVNLKSDALLMEELLLSFYCWLCTAGALVEMPEEKYQRQRGRRFERPRCLSLKSG